MASATLNMSFNTLNIGANKLWYYLYAMIKRESTLSLQLKQLKVSEVELVGKNVDTNLPHLSYSSPLITKNRQISLI